MQKLELLQNGNNIIDTSRNTRKYVLIVTRISLDKYYYGFSIPPTFTLYIYVRVSRIAYLLNVCLKLCINQLFIQHYSDLALVYT